MIGSATSVSFASKPHISTTVSALPDDVAIKTEPVLDKIDLSAFQVTSTDTDAGKGEKSVKERMSIKDYIAYMLLLLQKLDSLKEPGAQPLNARLENKDEMAAVLDALGPPGS